MKNIDAILLAAGKSSRFGGDKRTHILPHGVMLHCALDAIVDAVRSVFVVLRTDDHADLLALLGHHASDFRVQVIMLDNPDAGMGKNLARAVEQLPGDCDAVLVALGDMPYLQPDTAKEIVSAYEPGKIAVPVYTDETGREQRGHPVLFSRKFFTALTALVGDVGARGILQENSADIVTVNVKDNGILHDVDIP